MFILSYLEMPVQKVTKKIIIINKKEGETPLQALEAFRAKNKEYKDLPITYAGRLDPMASGVLILLAGEEAKNKEKYLALDKEYEFEILFGFATDTYDILGKVVIPRRQRLGGGEFKKEIEQNLKYFTGNFMQKYPPYSSKTVKGKPMFEYSRKNINIEAPEREVNVKSLKLIKIRKIQSKKLLENIERRIQKVTGDFRQKEIIKLWQKNFAQEPFLRKEFFVASFKIKCGSGTYVRGIANSLGEKIGIPALAYSIKRTRVGKYQTK